MKALRELMDMSRRVVLITGGAGHVGRTAAETFLELGARPVLLDLGSAAEEAADALSERLGAEVLASPCDLEHEQDVVGAVESVAARLGRLDVLVNAAALVGTSDLAGWVGSIEEQSPRTWRRALEINLTAPFVLARAATPFLRAAPAGGAVINVSSIYGSVGPDRSLYGELPMGTPAAYAASKGGLEQLTRWLATTLAPDVRVNAIAPGGIERGQADEFRRRYSDRTPLGRMATEEDLKGALAYLGSDLSRYVTGTVLAVDGGWLAW